MIRVTYEIGDRLYLDMEGHSGTANAGQDVICAYLSGIGCTMVCGMGQKEMKPGKIIIECKRTAENEAILRSGIAAIGMAAERLPEVITINEISVHKPEKKNP